MTNQILDFGLAGAYRFTGGGTQTTENYRIAQELLRQGAGDSGHRGRAHPPTGCLSNTGC